MAKTKAAGKNPSQPLAVGQVWRMADCQLRVGQVGKLLVHYKLGKLDAVRVPNSINSISVVKQYLKKNKAKLVRA